MEAAAQREVPAQAAVAAPDPPRRTLAEHVRAVTLAGVVPDRRPGSPERGPVPAAAPNIARRSSVYPFEVCAVRGGTKTRREPAYRYAESGLSNVVLINAVTTTCSRCGEIYTGFHAIERLHKAIAAALIRKKGRLAPEEIRFLRKSLGWSGVDFARRMGTTKETVSRWESGKLSMGPQADRLLRMFVAKGTPIEQYPVDVLSEVAADGPARPARVELEDGPKGWTFRPGPALVS